MSMTLVRIADLAGHDVAGVHADIRSRNADGSLRYEHQEAHSAHDERSYLVALESVKWSRRRRKDAAERWLEWRWAPRYGFDGYSGVREDALREGEDYYLLLDHLPADMSARRTKEDA